MAVLGAWNLKRDIIPASKPENNSDLQRALWVATKTPSDAWMLADGIDQVYFPYFAGRQFINLRYYVGHENTLWQLISSLIAEGHPVFFVPEALPQAWHPWLKTLRAKREDSREPWELLEILPPSRQ